MYLYFERSNGEMILVTDGIASEEDVMPFIRQDLKKRNPKFKVYYIRVMHLSDGICYDVGSHTEFYWLKEEKIVE